jgi:hypothetical protein
MAMGGTDAATAAGVAAGKAAPVDDLDKGADVRER